MLAQGVGRVAVLLGEQALLGAARQRLVPERARTCKQVGDDQSLETAEAAREHREERFARAVGGRAGGVVLRRAQFAAAPFASDGRHQPRRRRNLNSSSRGTTSNSPQSRSAKHGSASCTERVWP